MLMTNFSFLLAVVIPHEMFHFQMLHLVQLALRVLLLYSAIANVSVIFRSYGPSWFSAVRVRGQSVLEPWSKEAFQSAEAVLTTFLQAAAGVSNMAGPPGGAIKTLPDCIFNMIGFCGSFMLACKSAVSKAVGAELPGSDIALILRVKETLDSQFHTQEGGGLFGEDHSSRRCARLLGILMDVWAQRATNGLLVRQRQGVSGYSGNGMSAPSEEDMGGIDYTTSRTPEDLGQPLQQQPNLDTSDSSIFLGMPDQSAGSSQPNFFGLGESGAQDSAWTKFFQTAPSPTYDF